jgi:hypothetical protein
LADPSSEFLELLADVELPENVNLYAAPTDEITAPAIVLRPDALWMEPSSFCMELERYSAIAVVTASTPGDGIALLRLLSLAIIGALVPPWDWESVEGPVIDETTGKPFLANRVKLTYKAGGS